MGKPYQKRLLSLLIANPRTSKYNEMSASHEWYLLKFYRDLQYQYDLNTEKIIFRRKVNSALAHFSSHHSFSFLTCKKKQG